MKANIHPSASHPDKMNKEQILAIERPAPTCAECNRPIEDLDRHPTRLKIQLDDQTKRGDYCPECWEFIKSEAYDSYWVTKREKRERRLPKLSRREKAIAARALFESLWDQRDREDVDADLYMLAHLLMKWGGLKWKADTTDEEGREIIVFENPLSGDRIEIRSVPMADEQAEFIKQRLEGYLREHAPDNDVAL